MLPPRSTAGSPGTSSTTSSAGCRRSSPVAAIVLESDGPSVADDPAGAWHAHVGAVQALLDGPDAGAEFSHPQVGSHRLDAAIDQFYTTDVFLHTWDLSRASGQDPTSTRSSLPSCWPECSRSTRCCASRGSTVRACRCRPTLRSPTS